MKLAFSEAEITAGVRHAVGIMGFDLTGKELTVEYSMGRSKNGLSAEVQIIDPTVEAQGAKAVSAVVIPGFTDTDEVKEPAKVEATVDPVVEPEAQTTGADATALFGDDD